MTVQTAGFTADAANANSEALFGLPELFCSRIDTGCGPFRQLRVPARGGYDWPEFHTHPSGIWRGLEALSQPLSISAS